MRGFRPIRIAAALVGLVLAIQAAQAQPRTGARDRAGPDIPASGHQSEAIDLNQGKTPAQMFASDCAVCHQRPAGLAKGRSAGQLTGFLRQHYTTGMAQAGIMAAYVASFAGQQPQAERPPAAIGTRRPQVAPDAEDAAPPRAQDRSPEQRRKPPAAQASRPGERDATPGRKPSREDGRRGGAKPVEKPAESKPAEAKPEDTPPGDAKPIEAAAPADPKPAESGPAEVKPSEAKPAETQPAERETPDVKPEEPRPEGSKAAETKPAPSEETPPAAKPSEPPAAAPSEPPAAASEPPAASAPAEKPDTPASPDIRI